jgi:hypothetical protein
VTINALLGVVSTTLAWYGLRTIAEATSSAIVIGLLECAAAAAVGLYILQRGLNEERRKKDTERDIASIAEHLSELVALMRKNA